MCKCPEVDGTGASPKGAAWMTAVLCPRAARLPVPPPPRSEQPRGDPGPCGGTAVEEALLWLQQVVPARGQHLGRGSCPLRAVHRTAH